MVQFESVLHSDDVSRPTAYNILLPNFHFNSVLRDLPAIRADTVPNVPLHQRTGGSDRSRNRSHDRSSIQRGCEYSFSVIKNRLRLNLEYLRR